MRLVAQRYGEIGNLESEPWWDRFVVNIIANDTFWTHYSVSEHKSMLAEILKTHGADLIETHFGLVLDFDNDAAATAFLLRWA